MEICGSYHDGFHDGKKGESELHSVGVVVVLDDFLSYLSYVKCMQTPIC